MAQTITRPTITRPSRTRTSITRLAIPAALVAATLSIAAPTTPALAYGDAPWCAVVNIGTGNVEWQCEYRTIEECVPNVLAGNRGFCELNPWGPPPAARTVTHPKYRKHHTAQ